MFCGLHTVETLYLKLDYKYYNIKYNFSQHTDFVFVISWSLVVVDLEAGFRLYIRPSIQIMADVIIYSVDQDNSFVFGVFYAQQNLVWSQYTMQVLLRI